MYDRPWRLKNIHSIHTSTINSKKVFSLDGWGYGHMQQNRQPEHYVSLVSSSQFSSQLYIPPSLSFSSSTVFRSKPNFSISQEMMPISWWCGALCNPCTTSFETPVAIPQIPLILSWHVSCCVLFFLPSIYFRRCSGSTSSHISYSRCAERGACQ